MPCVRDGEHFNVLNMRQAIPPVGDSKSDFEAVVEISKKLGMEEEVTIGRTIDEYIEGVYKGMNFDRIVSWEEFQEKDYMVIPVSDNWKKSCRTLRVLQRPRGKSAAHAYRKIGVLFNKSSEVLPQ